MDINSSRFRVELDKHIMGGRYRRWTEELECKHCGKKWEARFEQEYGVVDYIMDDNLCPECGADYEEAN